MAKKHITVVLEFAIDTSDYAQRVGESVLGTGLPSDPFEKALSCAWLQQELTEALDGVFAPEVSYRFMEVTEAPYGPQNPHGVYLTEVVPKCSSSPEAIKESASEPNPSQSSGSNVPDAGGPENQQS